MRFLSRKQIDSTLIYIQLEEKLFNQNHEEFIVKLAHNTQKACSLIEVGFQYVTSKYCDAGKVFRKRK